MEKIVSHSTRYYLTQAKPLIMDAVEARENFEPTADSQLAHVMLTACELSEASDDDSRRGILLCARNRVNAALDALEAKER